MTRRLVYDVAVSIDGFIDAGDGDASAFPTYGDHVDAYQARLAGYDAVIMGRNTYEVGYRYGMKPGDTPYPNLKHYVISRQLRLPHESEVELVRTEPAHFARYLKASEGGDIYLCGGGVLAGGLLRAGLIDRLILKVNPIVLGAGTPLFGETGGKLNIAARFRLADIKRYNSGVALLVYDPAAA